MKELNGPESRPIKVIDDYSFSIENTSEFRPYQKGGFAQQIKVPFRINFNSFDQELKNPQFSAQIYKTAAEKKQAVYLHLIF
jgi:hypothetical protein